MTERNVVLRNDAQKIIESVGYVSGAAPVSNVELRAVLAIFEVDTVAEISTEQEPAFRRYLNARSGRLLDMIG